MERETVKAMRLLLGLPVLSCMLIISLESYNSKYAVPWDAITFLAGFGLAIVLKIIEIIVYKIGK